jgi:hypothetical protein
MIQEKNQGLQKHRKRLVFILKYIWWININVISLHSKQDDNTMGYTHYWEFNPKGKQGQPLTKVYKTNTDFIDAGEEVRQLNQSLSEEFQIGGCEEDNVIEINKEVIAFNGKEGEKCEDFVVDIYPTNFKFCKTNHKPYDFMVMLSLIAIANNVEGFEFSSDGRWDVWEPAAKHYERHIGKISYEIFREIKGFELDLVQ